MNQDQLYSFSHTCWIKKRCITFVGAIVYYRSANVISITFYGKITVMVVTVPVISYGNVGKGQVPYQYIQSDIS